jgi:hypothetical protein
MTSNTVFSIIYCLTDEVNATARELNDYIEHAYVEAVHRVEFHTPPHNFVGPPNTVKT